MQEEDQTFDSILIVKNESMWFRARVMDGLEKTKNIFSILEQECNATPRDFNTLQDVLQDLGAVGGSIFCSLYSKKEWQELEASQEAIQSEDAQRVRAIRIARQRGLIEQTKSVAVDCLDGSVVGELKSMLQELTVRLSVLEERVPPKSTRNTNNRGKDEEDDDDDSNEHDDDDDRNNKREREKQNKITWRRKKRSSKKKKKVVVLKEASSSVKQVVKRVAAMDLSEDHADDDDDDDDSEEVEKDKEELEKDKEEQEEEIDGGGDDDDDFEEDDGGVQDMDLEEEDDDEEKVKSKSQPSKILTAAEQSVNMVSNLLKLSGQSLPVAKLVPPDPRDAQPQQGELLTKDRDRLLKCLNDGETLNIKDLGPLEKVSRLLSWWRLCDRAFAVASLLEYYRQTYPGVYVEEYTRLVDGLRDIKGLGYKNALKYEKLSKFLCQYPRFLYQIEVTSLSKWMTLLAKDRLVTDPTFNGDFWKQKVVRNNDEQREACFVCNTSEHVAELWHCSECTRCFHAQCCGYEEGKLCKEVILVEGDDPLKHSIYCSSCLTELDITHKNVTDEMQEFKAFSIFLNDPQCPFDYEEIEGDGYCIFSILENYARDSLQYPSENSSHVFCGALADAALGCLERTQQELQNADDHQGNDALEDANPFQIVLDEAKASLQKLQKARNRVERLKGGLWKEIEVQYLLPGYVTMFPGRVRVRIYGHDDRGRVVPQGEPYGRDGGESVLYVLQWKTLEHYDRLVLVKKKD